MSPARPRPVLSTVPLWFITVKDGLVSWYWVSNFVRSLQTLPSL